MKKTKLLVIAPYEGMRDLILDIAEQRQDVELSVYLGDLEEGVRIVSKNENYGYAAIISRGGTAKLIQDMTRLPVSEINISVYDILRAIKLAQGYEGTFAIVGFPSITKTAKILCDVLQYDVDIFTIQEQEEVGSLLESLKKRKYSLIVGDAVTVTKARQLGLNGILIISGCESLEAAIDHALTLCSRQSILQKNTELFGAVLENSPRRIVAMNTDGSVYYTTLAADVLNEHLRAFKRLLPTVLSDGGIQQMCAWNQRVVSLCGQRIEVSFGTLVVFSVHLTDLPCCEQGRAMRFLQRAEAHKRCVENPLSGFSVFPEEVANAASNHSRRSTPVIISGEPGVGKEYLATSIYLNGIYRNNSMAIIDCGCLSGQDWTALMDDADSPFCGHGLTLLLSNARQLAPERAQQLIDYFKNSAVLSRNHVLLSFETREELPQSHPLVAELMNELGFLLIRIPPLRERLAILPSIASLLIGDLNAQFGKSILGFSAEAMERLLSFPWPQNMDQFLRVLKQSIFTSGGPYISENVVVAALENEQARRRALSLGSGLDLNRPLDEIVHDIVMEVLREESMNQSRAARRLGIGRSTLWRMLKQA